MRRYYLVPSSVTAAQTESSALEVLAQLLGSGSNAYLYRALVVDKPLAVSAGAWYQGTGVDPTQFGISASPKPGVDFAQVEQTVDEVLTRLARDPVPAEDLERVKTQMIAESVYAQDSQTTLARWYGAAITVGLSVDDVIAWPERIRAVTAEQVRDAARKWLEKKRSVTGYLVKDTSATSEKREEKRS
jgi:zinc protease